MPKITYYLGMLAGENIAAKGLPGTLVVTPAGQGEGLHGRDLGQGGICSAGRTWSSGVGRGACNPLGLPACSASTLQQGLCYGKEPVGRQN